MKTITNVWYEFDGFGYHSESDNILDLITTIYNELDDVSFVQSPSLKYEYIVTRPNILEQGIVELKCL
jgi:hypothetical protein